MPLFPKLRALQRRSELAQCRCETLLVQLSREDDGLCHEAEALERQIEGVQQWLHSPQVTGVVLNRDQLFAQLRKQAVLQHQLHNLALQRMQLHEQRQLLASRRTRQQRERQLWLRKEHKYQRWSTRERDQMRLQRLRQDEVELEEVALWNR
ncbi:hypothetical protein [Aeromonas cavernicola]|nr:hypothetical protein [Aeromonas cavernicola]